MRLSGTQASRQAEPEMCDYKKAALAHTDLAKNQKLSEIQDN